MHHAIISCIYLGHYLLTSDVSPVAAWQHTTGPVRNCVGSIDFYAYLQRLISIAVRKVNGDEQEVRLRVASVCIDRNPGRNIPW